MYRTKPCDVFLFFLIKPCVHVRCAASEGDVLLSRCPVVPGHLGHLGLCVEYCGTAEKRIITKCVYVNRFSDAFKDSDE